MLMDVNLLVHPPTWSDTRPCLHHEDIILLLSRFTRVHSLCLTGSTSTINPVINSLCHSLPIQSLSLCIANDGRKLILPDDLFGGKAPIRHLQFIANHGCRPIVAPSWLLRSVTHLTSKMSDTPSQLLGELYSSWSALTHFEYQQPYHLRWRNSGMGNLPTSPIQLPQLVNLVVRARVPDPFILLHRLLLPHVDAKWRLELYASADHEHPTICKPFNAYQINYLSRIVEAANGFKHIHISGTQMEGWCRLWTGNAKFCLSLGWVGFQKKSLNQYITTCDALGTGMARVRRLVIDSPQPGLPMSSWWKLLGNLPGIEELQLYPASVDTLGAAWKVNLAPAVLPALRKVRIVDPSLASPQQYAIIGDPPARKIVRLPSYANSEDDIASFPDLVPAEKELENMSKALLKMLRGLGRKLHSD
jgi:hypothetical protein